MPKLKRSSKLIAILVVSSLFLTACEVPDISKFTEQSSEMTRGIRKGIKDTESLLKAAAERDDLYSDTTIAEIQAKTKDYQKAMKPTVAALDALDSYLEALNALAQANKKSGENARAVVTSVGNLVNAATGFTISGSVLNIATGLVTLAEQFRTAKDFKKRVTLAAEIVEGIRPDKDAEGKLIFRRNCTADANAPIIAASKIIRKTAEDALNKTPLTKKQSQTLNGLSPAEKWSFLRSEGVLDKGQFETITAATSIIDTYHCGVIDFIKFNVEDLREINDAVAQDMYRNAREKNRVVLGFYESIVANDRAVQNELDRILNVKALIPVINQYVNNGADTRAIETKRTLKNTLDSLFILDPDVDTAVTDAVTNCGVKNGAKNCGEMLALIQLRIDPNHCDADCRKALLAAMNDAIKKTDRAQFERSMSLILGIIDDKAKSLSAQNKLYLEELARIKPSYDAVNTELNTIKNKQTQLDSLLESSLTALDAWAETHANLRVAVQTKKPLTAAKLASKVRELWGIINPETD